jgi:hypothetical protein
MVERMASMFEPSLGLIPTMPEVLSTHELTKMIGLISTPQLKK